VENVLCGTVIVSNNKINTFSFAGKDFADKAVVTECNTKWNPS
jgi:hypothetical protein